MEWTSTLQDPQSLLCVEVRGSAGPVDVRDAYKALLVTVARAGVRRLLLDYSALPVDITLEDFIEIRTRCRRLFEALRAVKTAVILRRELASTMMLMAAMRTFGIRVVAFTDRDEALAWLLWEDGRAP